MQDRRESASGICEGVIVLTLKIDSADLKQLERALDRMQARLPQAISRGLNEGGDRVRTQVQRALQKQTGLVRYASVTKRVRTARAYATGLAPKSGIGPSRPGSLSYQIIVSGKPPTRPDEFRTRVTTGPGGGVIIFMWGIAHKFKRSFQQKFKLGLRARLGAARDKIRGFDGPNLAKEAVKDQTAEAFFRTADAVVVPIVEKAIMRALK
jgi:hypothetical protein